jgi:hypothetical protein
MINILLSIVVTTKFVDCRPYAEFLELKKKFHACQKTETILKIDDDDDRNFNVLNVISKESLFHEINLKNRENIFVFSEILYIANYTQIEAINIPKSIKGCFKFLFIKYY